MTPAPLTTKQLAARWGVSLRSVQRLIKTGALEAISITPRRQVIPWRVIEAYEAGLVNPSSTGGAGTSTSSGPKGGARVASQQARLIAPPHKRP
jgi:hypothetical protein